MCDWSPWSKNCVIHMHPPFLLSRVEASITPLTKRRRYRKWNFIAPGDYCVAVALDISEIWDREEEGDGRGSSAPLPQKRTLWKLGKSRTSCGSISDPTISSARTLWPSEPSLFSKGSLHLHVPLKLKEPLTCSLFQANGICHKPNEHFKIDPQQQCSLFDCENKHIH